MKKIVEIIERNDDKEFWAYYQCTNCGNCWRVMMEQGTEYIYYCESCNNTVETPTNMNVVTMKKYTLIVVYNPKQGFVKEIVEASRFEAVPSKNVIRFLDENNELLFIIKLTMVYCVVESRIYWRNKDFDISTELLTCGLIGKQINAD